MTDPTNSEPSPAQSFDLTQFAAADRRSKRIGLYLRIGGSVFLVILALWFSAGALHDLHIAAGAPAIDQAALIALVVVVWILALTTLFSIPSFLPGGSALRIDATGVAIIYARGPIEELSWTSPKTRFQIRDFSSEPVWTRAGMRFILERTSGLGARHRWTIIPEDAVESILALSRERGLEIKTARGSVFSTWSRPVIHTVRVVAWTPNPD